VRLERFDSWKPIELYALFRQQVLGHTTYDIHVDCSDSSLLNLCNYVLSMLY
jgi:hypothetical protein